MIIELVGFSSTGKTTIKKKISSELNNRGFIFFCDEEIFKKKINKNFHFIIDLFINCALLIYFPFFYFNESHVNKIILDIVRKANISLYKKLNYYRIYIKRTMYYNLFANSYFQYKSNYILDEGTFQAFLNILIHVNSNNINIKKSINKIKFPNLLIYFKPNIKEIKTRLDIRGNRYKWSKLKIEDLKFYINKFDKYFHEISKLISKSNLSVIIVESDDYSNIRLITESIIKEFKEDV